MAKGARSDVDAAMLEEMAAELLEEADRIDVTHGGKLAEKDR